MTVFAGIAFLAALGGLFLSDRPKPKEAPSWPALGAAVLLSLFGWFALKQAQPADSPLAAMPFLLGAGAVLLVGVLENFRTASPAVSVGVATLAAAAASPVAPVITQVGLAGAAIAALVVGSEGAMIAAFSTGSLLCLAQLTQTSAAQPGALVPMIGALMATVCLLPPAAAKVKKVPSAVLPIASAVILGLGVTLALRSSGNEELSKSLILPLVAGLAIHWLLGKDEPRPISTQLIVGLIWLGGATLAFATMKSAGLALWLILGTGIPLALGNSVAVGSAAPLAALTWYRLVQSDLTGGSDLSRFYILTGLAAGIGLVATGWEWRGRVEGLPGAIGGGLWAFLSGGVAILAGVVFGSRGFVGVLEGSGLGSMLSGNHKRPLTPALLSAAMATTGALCLPVLQSTAPYGRDEKTKLFLSATAAILLVAGTLYALQLDKGREAAK